MSQAHETNTFMLTFDDAELGRIEADISRLSAEANLDHAEAQQRADEHLAFLQRELGRLETMAAENPTLTEPLIEWRLRLSTLRDQVRRAFSTPDVAESER